VNWPASPLLHTYTPAGFSDQRGWPACKKRQRVGGAKRRRLEQRACRGLGAWLCICTRHCPRTTLPLPCRLLDTTLQVAEETGWTCVDGRRQFAGFSLISSSWRVLAHRQRALAYLQLEHILQYITNAGGLVCPSLPVFRALRKSEGSAGRRLSIFWTHIKKTRHCMPKDGGKTVSERRKKLAESIR